MIALLLPLARPALPYLLAGAAVLGVLAWAYHRGDLAARREADRAALVLELDQRRTRDAVDRSVAADADPGAALLREWGRD